ncbi:uncharacterized protein, PH0010 family/AmmeMemoRadiSam system protein A/AmmeMemoRadiSam system protein B [Peptoclostridium litorale DSM 5388]|uniref:AMMECR1 domain-containing protein n=1 Tax=Peptoclostridium litorale DSM 5388 TaxID=1121324 RepID=A0A069R9P1_PEPLI|nr:AmmeMemoRadiSam system protein A [Peptoclostridium litorale]KDR93784.1 hypothetical protein CLIT_23c00560 [Peptoclostridium litorale DSM 5388]SIN85794.1 uncharacterized protein, PH0010 family/AmmeMemoRadiSam system protein A/AmmeMemoRadiSam system protein B [Peptoclostridium litorale DSM 5388]
MNLKGVAFSPHPPIIIPEVGMGEEKGASKTIEGMEKMAKDVAVKAPKVIVLITPHGNVFSDGLCILDDEVLRGDLGKFARPDVRFERQVDQDLQHVIREQFEKDKVQHIFIDGEKAQEYMVDMEIDHGCAVPLYYIQKEYNEFKIIHMTIGMLSIMDMYRAGVSLAKAIEKSGRDTVIVASGDLSHRLSSTGPYSYNPKGAVFDGKIVDALRHGDFERAISIPRSVYEPAGECGYRSIAMALGSVDMADVDVKIYSYEGPFGVGYMTGFLDVKGEKKDSLLDMLERRDLAEMKAQRQSEDDYIKLARHAVESWVKEGRTIDLDYAGDSIGIDTESMEMRKAAAFVSIYKEGMLRGCVGTMEPVMENVAHEIIKNAISAASNDPRFSPIRSDEIERLDIKVDVLGDPELVQSKSELDENDYGVIIVSGSKKGVLLPKLEGVDSVERQIEIVKKKAGIEEGEKYDIYRFKVERHEHVDYE